MKFHGIAIAFIVTLMALVSFDASSDPSDPSSKDSNSVAIASEIPFAEGNHIAGNIKSECNLSGKLSEFIKSYSQDNGISIEQKSAVSANDPGRVLVVEITDAVSMGNAFIGHRKYTQISGKLYQDSKMVGSFEGARNSGGGAFAGFKGSCAVLGRCVKALGRDVGNWLKSPTMDASLGDMR